MIELKKYAKIKDKYCVCYFGNSDEYLTQLKLLKPVFENHFPGLEFCIGCKDEKQTMFPYDVLTISQLKARREEFAHIRELNFNGNTHPVEDLINESGISPRIKTGDSVATKKCVIVTHGSYPTKPLELREIKILEKMASELGFESEIDTDINNSGMVIGVESVSLFEAASRGTHTKLFPTGIGTRLYKMMFESGQVLHR